MVVIGFALVVSQMIWMTTIKKMSRRALVRQLESARDHFCGIGTRKVKLQLNRIGANDALARAFRLALEIEDCSTQGKKYGRSEWSDEKYREKTELIEKLCRLCEIEGWLYGKHFSDNWQTKHIVYFELPGCEQISFHTNLSIEIPDYPKQWDGKTHSTLQKLEAAITAFLADENQQRFELPDEDYWWCGEFTKKELNNAD